MTYCFHCLFGIFRYNLYIDCMPMEGVGELDQASLKRMTEWAKGAPALYKDKRYQHFFFRHSWILVLKNNNLNFVFHNPLGQF